MASANAWCEILGIVPPVLADVRRHPEANTYGLLLVALLERGEPMTLPEVAARFAEAGVAPREDALRSLKRCRPARAPVYRDGDRYTLDPYDDELDFWAFRLGLRPARGAPVPPPPAPVEVAAPLPGADVPLTTEELAEAFRGAWLTSWSALRMAMAVLDARGPRLPIREVLAVLDELGTRHSVRPGAHKGWRKAAVSLVGEEDWTLDRSHPAVAAMRKAVRARVEVERRRRAAEPDPEEVERHRTTRAQERKEHGARLAALRRVLVHAAPPREAGGRPPAVTFADLDTGAITTLTGAGVEAAGGVVSGYDVVAGVDVRATLRSLGIDMGALRLDELAPPQKSLTTPQGRPVQITTAMLITGSCRIARPLTPSDTLERYVDRGGVARLGKALESDVRSLAALYRYGRLHGWVRLRWRGMDERFRVPWVHRDEPRLGTLLQEALTEGATVDVVAGEAPPWDDPWETAIRCRVVPAGRWGWPLLVDEDGFEVPEEEVQRARVTLASASPPDPVATGLLGGLAAAAPWDWPPEAGAWILEVLLDGTAPPAERVAAAELAGHLPGIDDGVAGALLGVLADAAELPELRAAAAIALGPVLEDDEWWGGDADEDGGVSPFLVRRIQATLRALHDDPATATEVRRRALEAAVRAPADWQREAAAAAFRSGSPEWRLSGVFAMGYLGGFPAEIVEALGDPDPLLRLEAIRAAGGSGEAAAWPHLMGELREAVRLAPFLRKRLTGMRRELVLAAIAAAASVNPDGARDALGELTDCDDPEIAEAALDVLLALEQEEEGEGPEGFPWPDGGWGPGGGGGTTFH